MVTEDQIQKLATKYQTSQLNVMREYLQHLFLSYFYQLPQTGEIYFKGGTALRIIYQSPRFSEDLDFSTNKKDVAGIENSLVEVLEEIEKENIEGNLQEAKTTIGGYLSIIDFMLFGQVVPIQIEISFRDRGNRGEIIGITDSNYVPPYNIVLQVEEQLIDEKMRVLLGRKKPRDFYDLYFILRSRMLPPEKKDFLLQVLKNLREAKINFGVELKQFLPKTHWVIIRDFKQTLKREIERSIK